MFFKDVTNTSIVLAFTAFFFANVEIFCLPSSRLVAVVSGIVDGPCGSVVIADNSLAHWVSGATR